jgi:hypothetical protein
MALVVVAGGERGIGPGPRGVVLDQVEDAAEAQDRREQQRSHADRVEETPFQLPPPQPGDIQQIPYRNAAVLPLDALHALRHHQVARHCQRCDAFRDECLGVPRAGLRARHTPHALGERRSLGPR